MCDIIIVEGVPRVEISLGPHHFLNKTPTLNQRISMAGYAVTEKGAERNVTYLCVFGDLQINPGCFCNTSSPL